MHMVKIVSLSEDAYDVLTRLKQAGDSYSDVVLRMAEAERGRRMEGTFGSWKMNDREYAAFMDEIYDRRRRSKARVFRP